MKKALLILFGILIIGIILVMSFGIQIGNVRIGKQNDTLGVKQNLELENSDFNKDYLQNDKLICINLWATWCKPCVAEIPMLNEIKSEYKHKNVEFLSLSVDTDSIKLNSFLKKGKFEYVDITLQNLEYRTAILNFLENKPADNKINSYSVPVTYLIKDKKILKKIDGELETKDELTGEIDKILK